MLSRYTKRLFINFDPDTAGANAAEKSIALLTEEDFEVKVVTLEGGLDPDRFIRERGIKDYVAAVKGARRHSDYLIDRAMQLFPSRTAEGKSKALNYLLPHIRRMPNRIVRDEFASDAAQKLGIDSALVREELRQAARKRRDEVHPTAVDTLNEAERVLLRAAASPPGSRVFLRVFQALHDQPQSFEGLSVTPMLDGSCATAERSSLWRPCPIPASERCWPRRCSGSPARWRLQEVEAALDSLKYRHLEALQRRVRADIAEAERRGDLAQLAVFMAEKLKVDRQMRDVDALSAKAWTSDKPQEPRKAALRRR